MLISLCIAVLLRLAFGRWRRAKASLAADPTTRFPVGGVGPADAHLLAGGVYEGHSTDDA